MAFTITTSNGGSSATVVGTNSSDAIAAAALANINTLSLTAFDADDSVFTGETDLDGGSSQSASSLSLGQGDDLVTLNAGITAAGSLVDLGDGSDTFTAGAETIIATSVKGFGGLDTFTFGSTTIDTPGSESISGTLVSTTTRSIDSQSEISNSFINGNAGTDRFTFTATNLTNTTVAGGSEDDVITFDGIQLFEQVDPQEPFAGTIISRSEAASLLILGRVNGQNGDDTITVNALDASSTATMFGGQGNDILTAARAENSRVIFSGDLGNDQLTGAFQGFDANGDKIWGGDGNDAIDGQGGADTLTGGNGVDTFTVTGSGTMTGVVQTDVGTQGVIDAGDVINLNTSVGDRFNAATFNITDFGSADVLNTVNGTNAATATGVAYTNNGNVSEIGSDLVTYKISGVYNSADTSFTVTADNTGTDTLIVLNGGAPGADSLLLLKGTSAKTLVAANFV